MIDLAADSIIAGQYCCMDPATKQGKSHIYYDLYHAMIKYSAGILVKNSPESTAILKPVINVVRTALGSSPSSKTTQTVEETIAHRILRLWSEPLHNGLSETELIMTGISSVK